MNLLVSVIRPSFQIYYIKGNVFTKSLNTSFGEGIRILYAFYLPNQFLLVFSWVSNYFVRESFDRNEVYYFH